MAKRKKNLKKKKKQLNKKKRKVQKKKVVSSVKQTKNDSLKVQNASKDKDNKEDNKTKKENKQEEAPEKKKKISSKDNKVKEVKTSKEKKQKEVSKKEKKATSKDEKVKEAKTSKENKQEEASEKEKETLSKDNKVKEEKKKFKLKYIIIILIALILIPISLYIIYQFNYPKFKNVTLNTGTNINKLSIELFIKNKGNLSDKASITYKNLKTITINDKKLIKSSGKYKVIIKDRGKTYKTYLKIKDDKAPNLTLKEVKIIEGTNININNFINSCEDNSYDKCTLNITDEKGKNIDLDVTVTDKRVIYITAKDKAGNKVTKETNLKVVSKKVVAERYNKCLTKTLDDNNFSENLKNIKTSILSLYNTNANFKYEDLNDGYTFNKNKNNAFYAASVNKLPLVLYAYYLADNGKLDLNQKMTYTSSFYHGGSGVIRYNKFGTVYTLNDLLDKTIIYSDNIAYFMLLTKINKSDVKSYFNKLGYNIIYTDNFGNVSPEGMSVYAKAAYNYYLKGTPNAKRLIDNMKKSDELDVIKNKDFTFALAHKYGYQGIYYNDVSIAFDKHPYTLSIMSTMGNTKEKDNFFLKSHKLINEFNNLYWQEKEAYCKKQAETI